MAIFIKTNDTTPEIDDIFDDSKISLAHTTGDGIYRVIFGNKLHVFTRTNNTDTGSNNRYVLNNYHKIYDFLTDTWTENLQDLPRSLTDYIKWNYLYLASDSNRIYFCFSQSRSNTISNGAYEYYHTFYGYDIDNQTIIDYTSKIQYVYVANNDPNHRVPYKYINMERWIIKNYSSDSILLSGYGLYKSGSSAMQAYDAEKKQLILGPTKEESTISESQLGINDDYCNLYDDGLLAYIQKGTNYSSPYTFTVAKNGISKTILLPYEFNNIDNYVYYTDKSLKSATFLRDQLHIFFSNKNGYYHMYTFKSNDSNNDEYVWLQGQTLTADEIQDMYPNGTFEYNDELYFMSRTRESGGYYYMDINLKKIYSRKERIFNDGTHGKIKGIWVKIKKAVKNASGNYEIVDDSNPKRVIGAWIRNGNSYEKILW